jgi:CBS domain-containing protein
MIDNRNVALNRKNTNFTNMELKYSSPVFTVESESSIFEALKQMQTNFVKHIVVASKNKPLGIVTERDINKFLENDKTARALNEIPVKHVMQKNIISIVDGLEDHFIQCASRMETFKIGAVVLMGSEGSMVGIVTKTDIAKAFSAVYGGKFLVKDYMTENAVTCRKSDSLKFALNVMNRNDISRLVVTDESGKPLGLITTNTLLTHSDYFSKGQTRSRDYLIPIGKDENITVGDLLKDELLMIEQEDDLATAASLMIKNKVSGIPVVDSKQNLVGIVSKFDIVRAFTVVGSNEEIKTKYRDLY